MDDMKQLYFHDGPNKDNLTGAGSHLEKQFEKLIIPLLKEYVIDYGCLYSEVNQVIIEGLLSIKFMHLAGYNSLNKENENGQ